MSVKKFFRRDYDQTKSLVEAGKKAATKAVRHAKALDITITYIKDGGVYEEAADGTVTLKRPVEQKELPFKLTKGMVLHGK